MIHLIFPKKCPFCADVLESPSLEICPECEKIVERFYVVREPVCKKCGKPLADKQQEYCYDCKHHTRSFVKGICLFQYGYRAAEVKGKDLKYHSMGESMQRFKYQGSRTYATYYIKKLMQVHGQELLKIRAQAIIPVPIHKKKYIKRGYNQAEVLANELSKALEIPVLSKFLMRSKETLAQKELTQEQRIVNLMDGFIVPKPMSKLKRVILIDDIYTTGATMEACTRKLLEAGVREVFCVSICSGQNG